MNKSNSRKKDTKITIENTMGTTERRNYTGAVVNISKKKNSNNKTSSKNK